MQFVNVKAYFSWSCHDTYRKRYDHCTMYLIIAQLGIQLDLNACKSFLASWAAKCHDYVPVYHPTTHQPNPNTMGYFKFVNSCL